MRLKILFFPMMLLASISFLIAFVWPEANEAVKLFKEKKASEERLNLINTKKQNIKKLDQNLGNNKDKEDFVIEYVPKNRMEEKIVDMANLLSSEASLTLTNISIEKDKSDPDYEENSASSLSKTAFNKNLNQNKGQTQAPAETPKIVINKKKTSLVISVMGKYDGIKSFISALNKSDMMNDIISVDVKPLEKKEGEEEKTIDPELLYADIAIDFYHFKTVKWNNDYNNELFLKSEFSFAAVDEIKKFIAKEMPRLDALEKGKPNPFL